ncbi:MAG: M15 family metallopeptidase [Psychrobium sp.]|nr:M15 family metallopeptidase [Psychrobium sp.]
MTPMQVVGQCEAHLMSVDANHLLHQHVINDWHQLVKSASNDGIDLTIASSFRSFERQRLIFNSKAQGLRQIRDINNQLLDFNELDQPQLLSNILHWSALPGASRHHWGCDIDVYAPSMLNQALKLEPWEYQRAGPMAALGIWLSENLSAHGFYMPYKTFNGGVAAEPWHISHIEQAQIAEKVLTLPLLRQTITQADVCLKPLILSGLSDIYQQFIINTSKP